jgi:hypothetical protein
MRGDFVEHQRAKERCYEQLSTGVLGSRLKTLLADHTVVFVGYSLTEPDLRRILDAVTAGMGELRETYYVGEATDIGDRQRHVAENG